MKMSDTLILVQSEPL